MWDLTPAVSRAARSEASGGHQPGTGWRRLDQPVRLGSEGRVLRFTSELILIWHSVDHFTTYALQNIAYLAELLA